jgi:archaeal flagellar protein FlaI
VARHHFSGCSHQTDGSQELIDESQIQIPIGFEIVNKYPLLPPFSYVNILYNREKSSYLYFVDEARLNSQEKQY